MRVLIIDSNWLRKMTHFDILLALLSNKYKHFIILFEPAITSPILNFVLMIKSFPTVEVDSFLVFVLQKRNS